MFLSVVSLVESGCTTRLNNPFRRPRWQDDDGACARGYIQRTRSDVSLGDLARLPARTPGDLSRRTRAYRNLLYGVVMHTGTQFRWPRHGRRRLYGLKGKDLGCDSGSTFVRNENLRQLRVVLGWRSSIGGACVSIRDRMDAGGNH